MHRFSELAYCLQVRGSVVIRSYMFKKVGSKHCELFLNHKKSEFWDQFWGLKPVWGDLKPASGIQKLVSGIRSQLFSTSRSCRRRFFPQKTRFVEIQAFFDLSQLPQALFSLEKTDLGEFKLVSTCRSCRRRFLFFPKIRNMRDPNPNLPVS